MATQLSNSGRWLRGAQISQQSSSTDPSLISNLPQATTKLALMNTPRLTLQWIPPNSLPSCAKLCQLFLIPVKTAPGAVQKQGFPAAEDTQRAGAGAQDLDQPISCLPAAGREPFSLHLPLPIGTTQLHVKNCWEDHRLFSVTTAT